MKHGRWIDWATFAATAALAFAVYLATLATDVTFGFAPVFSVAAMYPSGSIPPGHPIWAVYGWLFVNAIPFSNITSRLAFASATAAAFSCGLLAVMVSRFGAFLVRGTPSNPCRIVCGAVAGLGFGFAGNFWGRAVVAETWTLTILFFAAILFLISRWFFKPKLKRWVYAAAFISGIAISESQALVPSIFAFVFLAGLGNRDFGRDLFFVVAFLIWTCIYHRLSILEAGWSMEGVLSIHIAAASLCTAGWIYLLARTRKAFTLLKSIFVCAVLFTLGLCGYFLLPIFSMTNPPINWGYARVHDGFFHIVSRGNYDRIIPTHSMAEFVTGWTIYGNSAATDLGILYVIAAAFPFLNWKRLRSSSRRWVAGLAMIWLFITTLTLVALNLQLDNHSVETGRTLFAPSHFLLALLAGYGLMLIVPNPVSPQTSIPKDAPGKELPGPSPTA